MLQDRENREEEQSSLGEKQVELLVTTGDSPQLRLWSERSCLQPS